MKKRNLIAIFKIQHAIHSNIMFYASQRRTNEVFREADFDNVPESCKSVIGSEILNFEKAIAEDDPYTVSVLYNACDIDLEVEPSEIAYFEQTPFIMGKQLISILQDKKIAVSVYDILD